MKEFVRSIRIFLYARVYRATRHWRKGLEPLSPEELMSSSDEKVWVTPTFRYFKPWPWDRGRPRWLPAYPSPDFTPSPKNILPYPERRALNKGRPEEKFFGAKADEFQVFEVRRGARVYDARFSAHGRQHSSDVWCKVQLDWDFLREDLQENPGSASVITMYDSRGEMSFYAWVPAIWLARAN